VLFRSRSAGCTWCGRKRGAARATARTARPTASIVPRPPARTRSRRCKRCRLARGEIGGEFYHKGTKTQRTGRERGFTQRRKDAKARRGEEERTGIRWPVSRSINPVAFLRDSATLRSRAVFRLVPLLFEARLLYLLSPVFSLLSSCLCAFVVVCFGGYLEPSISLAATLSMKARHLAKSGLVSPCCSYSMPKTGLAFCR